MSHVTKLVFRIIMNGIQGMALNEIETVQNDFMPDRGERNAAYISATSVGRTLYRKAEG